MELRVALPSARPPAISPRFSGWSLSRASSGRFSEASDSPRSESEYPLNLQERWHTVPLASASSHLKRLLSQSSRLTEPPVQRRSEPTRRLSPKRHAAKSKSPEAMGPLPKVSGVGTSGSGSPVSLASTPRGKGLKLIPTVTVSTMGLRPTPISSKDLQPAPRRSTPAQARSRREFLAKLMLQRQVQTLERETRRKEVVGVVQGKCRASVLHAASRAAARSSA